MVCGRGLVGASVAATASAAPLLWPKPQNVTVGSVTGVVEPSTFSFEAVGKTSDTLAAAFQRYDAICFGGRSARRSDGDIPSLRSLLVNVSDDSLVLGPDTDESYELQLAFPDSVLTAKTVYGAIRGLETFSQGLTRDLQATEMNVTDAPRYPFRGLLVDSGRHFLPVPLLKANIDAMAYNKMNVLHWHIVDGPSFPYESKKFPELHKQGRFINASTYSQKDVADIIEYARLRAVRVIPEFDTPGHTYPSWRGGGDDLLTKCSSGGIDGVGNLRADLESTYDFLDSFLQEIAEVFPDAVFHAGADEVRTACWMANADVTAFLKQKNWTANDLVAYYMRRLFNITNRTMVKTPMMWRPGGADQLTPATFPAEAAGAIFDIYGNYGSAAAETTAAGFSVVRSDGFYLDQLCPTAPDGSHHGTYWGWFDGWAYYDSAMDPATMDAGGDASKVLGGKANMWGEHFDATNFLPTVWPRTSVLAERFWSPAETTKSIDEAAPRLHDFRCRMVARGIAAAPIAGTGYHVAGCEGNCNGFCEEEFVFHYEGPGERSVRQNSRLSLV